MNANRALTILSALALLFAIGRYVSVLAAGQQPLLMRELIVADTFEPTLSPLRPGSLDGANVVVVTLDTTRPDRLGIYGNAEIATPTIDRFASEGVVFSNAIATGVTTLPTHASIWTGLYPHHHGARANGLYTLQDDVPTLAGVLRDAGYDTAAFVSNYVLDSDFGLARGFDVYDDDVPMGRDAGNGRRADATGREAQRWLSAGRDAPFLLWVHYFDPHAPYAPPREFAAASANAYDGEIAFVDAQLALLEQAVADANGRPTLWVLTADHGEGLGEQGEWTHGFLLQEATMRIPLILRAPHGVERGSLVDARVSQVDLMPSILGALGIDTDQPFDGSDWTRGVDPERSLLAEAAMGRASYGWSALRGLYEAELKLIDGVQPELYDLGSDPFERTDLATTRPDELERMRERLRALSGEAGQHFPEPDVALESEELARLHALGYVIGSSTATAANNGPNPRDLVPLLYRMFDLETELAIAPSRTVWRRALLKIKGKPVIATRDDLIAEYQRIADETADFAPAHLFLAHHQRIAGRNAEAESSMARFEEITGRPAQKWLDFQAR